MSGTSKVPDTSKMPKEMLLSLDCRIHTGLSVGFGNPMEADQILKERHVQLFHRRTHPLPLPGGEYGRLWRSIPLLGGVRGVFKKPHKITDVQKAAHHVKRIYLYLLTPTYIA